MAVMHQKPKSLVCMKCGGKIGWRGVSVPGNEVDCCSAHRVIGPGREPLWVLDKERHICQNPPDFEAIAEAQKVFAEKFPELGTLKRFLRKRGSDA